MNPQDFNKRLLEKTDLTEGQKELLLKTSATFSREEIRELEKLLQNARTSAFLYTDMAYHR